MTPFAHFQLVWTRCDQLSVLHTFVAAKVTQVMNVDELLRSEWVMRVSALDLYVHELVSQVMVEIFEGIRPSPQGYLRFQTPIETLDRIRKSKSSQEASSAFDLEVRSQLARVTYQKPETIAEGIRLCSPLELWNEVALKMGAANKNKTANAKALKKDLSIIIDRRNKIAHEGDLKPVSPREPWPINKSDLSYVKEKIESIVTSIDSVIYPL